MVKTQRGTNYRDLDYKPCEYKKSVLGYALEYTSTFSDEKVKGSNYMIGIKQSPVLATMDKDVLELKRISDQKLLLKSLLIKEVSKVNIPALWLDPSVTFKCI